jgi:hypothetical protein
MGGEQLQQDRMGGLAVEDHHALHAPLEASMQVSTFGIIPPEIVPSLNQCPCFADVSSLISFAVLVEDAWHIGQEQQS